MGFSSFNCLGCGHPMLSLWARNETNAWMSQVVVIKHDGQIIEGEYDGYGRVSPTPIDPDKFFDGIDERSFVWDLEELPGCWHKACWVVAGKPTEHRPSTHSEDQGYFFEDPAHDMAEPTTEGTDA